MSFKIDVTKPLCISLDDSLDAMKGLEWVINENKLGAAYVQLELDKSNVAAYKGLARQINGDQQESIFKKIAKLEKKIVFFEKVISYLSGDNSEAIDPRIEKASAKISKMQNASIEKIEKYTQRLNRICDSHLNFTSFIQKDNNKTQLADLRRVLLQKQGQKNICEISTKHLYKYLPENVDNLSSCLKEGRDEASYNFLISLFFGNINFSNCDAEFINKTIKEGHEFAANQQGKISRLQNIFTLDCDHAFCKIKLDQNPALSFSMRPDEGQFLTSLDAILFAKKTSNLGEIAAMIGFGDRHLMLVVDKEGIIYLFNQYGDKESKSYPYISAFGNLNHAAHFLENLMIQEMRERPFEGRTVTITAACNREDLEEPFEFPPRPTLETVALPAVHLKRMIECLSLCNEEGFLAAATAIPDLNQFQFHSPINGDHVKEAGDRLFYHLYQIQNKETPEKIDRKDMAWGANAFQSEDLSSAEERLRATQRAQTEYLLSVLCVVCADIQNSGPDAQNNPQVKFVLSLLFKELEELKLDPKDLPQGTKNLAYFCFGNLYTTYLAAWEQNQAMVHPNDPCFNGNFGREALLGDASARVPVFYKAQMLKQVAQSLKEAWGL